MKRWHLIIDVAECEDCNNCFLSCKDEHVDNDWPGYSLSQPRHGHRWMNILRKERGQHPLIDVAYLPMPCMHCRNAPCMSKAKEDAVYRREDGIVIIDPEKSKGQKGIVDACPYNVVWWNEKEVHVSKPTDYENARLRVSALDGERGFFQLDDQGNLIDHTKKYKNWSKIITKYEPVLEKDMWHELY